VQTYLLRGFRKLIGSETEPAESHDSVVKEADKTPKQLPNEIIDVILDISKANKDLSGLAAVARANRQMYDLAIEKLYETITMTEWNENQIAYGTKPYSRCGEYSTVHKVQQYRKLMRQISKE
jgi:hypothetical protein